MPESPNSGVARALTSPPELTERFHIVRCLGSGGMGDVYLAEDATLRRFVAIKSIRREMCQQPEFRKRIERECLLHAKIGSHPHIVTLFDRIEHADGIHLVMEYVEGKTLHDVLVNGPTLTWQEAVGVISQVLEALARIHAHDIVHRDIKPSNILLTWYESGGYCAKLLDFGIARMTAGHAELSVVTREDSGGPGTPIYMAPEQIDSRTFGVLSPATDIYAVGVMLYQMLSGRPPFQGSITEIFNGHLNFSPPPFTTADSQPVPAVLVAAMRKALAKRPGERFESALAFRDALQLALKGATTSPSLDATQPVKSPSNGGHGTDHAFGAAVGSRTTDGPLARKHQYEQHSRRSLAMVAVVLGSIVIVVGGVGVLWRSFGNGGAEAAGSLESTSTPRGVTGASPFSGPRPVILEGGEQMPSSQDADTTVRTSTDWLLPSNAIDRPRVDEPAASTGLTPSIVVEKTEIEPAKPKPAPLPAAQTPPAEPARQPFAEPQPQERSTAGAEVATTGKEEAGPAPASPGPDKTDRQPIEEEDPFADMRVEKLPDRKIN